MNARVDFFSFASLKEEISDINIIDFKNSQQDSKCEYGKYLASSQEEKSHTIINIENDMNESQVGWICTE